jgi:hypothetical protein
MGEPEVVVAGVDRQGRAARRSEPVFVAEPAGPAG